MSEIEWIKTPHGIIWFKDSPYPGDPECICSVCDQAIQEEEMPLRIWREGRNLEARLCEKCQLEYLGIENFHEPDLYEETE